jgi:hypothetical protein
MTRSDLKPSVEATLKYLDGTTEDLTDASGVVLIMKKENGQVIISEKAGSIIDSAPDNPDIKPSIVRYDWEEDDTDVVGFVMASLW